MDIELRTAIEILAQVGAIVALAATGWARLKTLAARLAESTEAHAKVTDDLRAQLDRQSSQFEDRLSTLQQHMTDKYTMSEVLHERCKRHWERLEDVREAIETLANALERRRR